MATPSFASVFCQAAGGDAESFVTLVTGLQREVRVFIAAYASSRQMVEDVQHATWSAVRRALPNFHESLEPVTWVLALAGRELGPRLEASDRVAVNEQDTLRHILARSGVEAFQSRNPAQPSPLAELEARLDRLDPSDRELLTQRYGERRRLADLTTLHGVSTSDIADRLFRLRIAMDWGAVSEATAEEEKGLLPALIEDYLLDSIDPDSRGLLAASLMKDMSCCLRFERQAHVDLVLTAMLAPTDSAHARTLAELVWRDPDGSSRPPPVSAPAPQRPMTDNGSPTHPDPDAHQLATGNRRSSSQSLRLAGNRVSSRISGRRAGMMIGMVASTLLLVGVVGLVLMQSGRAATPAPVPAPIRVPSLPIAQPLPPMPPPASASAPIPAPIPAPAPALVAPHPATVVVPDHVFLRGIHFGGEQVTIAGNQWLSQRQAQSAGLDLNAEATVAGGGGGGATDFDTRTMLAAGVASPSGEVQLSQRLPNGTYDLWLWVAAPGTLDLGTLAIRVGGRDQPLGQATERHDGWCCLGPYETQVAGQRLDLAVAGLHGAYLAGLALTAKTAPVAMLPMAVSLVQPSGNERRYQNETVTLRAELAPADGIVRVEFYDGATKLGEAGAAPFALDWPVTAAGTHTLSAHAIARDGEVYTSPPVTMQAIPGGTGSILREWWSGIPGDYVADLVGNPRFGGPPSGIAQESAFIAPRNWADAYGQRMRGWVHPPVSGAYTFWISSDDQSELWLSPDDQPANRVRIAEVSWAVPFMQWEERRGQRSAPVRLEAGRRYYIEALHKEGGGDDFLAVGWQWPDGTLERPIPGRALSPCSAATTATPHFVKGIDFGGEAVVIEGNSWLSQRQAEEDNASAPPMLVYVSDLPFREIANGNGPVQRDHSTASPVGRKMTIAGATFAKGLGTHARGEVAIALDGKYATFLAEVGVDDETGDKGSPGFQVLADGVVLTEIPVMHAHQRAIPIRVPVTGRKELRLVTTDGGDNQDWDHADWGNARLLRAGLPSGPLVVKAGHSGLAVVAPKPAVGAAEKAMLCSSLAGTRDGTLAFTQNLPIGRYQVYVWVMETGSSNSRLFDLDLNGETLADLGNLPSGGWEKYGPCTVMVTEGVLAVTAKPRKGVPALMGMAIFTAP